MDRPYARAVRRQIERRGLAAQVMLLGALSGGDLADCLARAHLLAVPSSYEGFGIVYLEGMGFGLPAIATTMGAAGEIITHEEDGFLVPPDDADALARHIRVLTADRERLLAMSLAARRRYDAHPTWEISMASVRHFLADLLSRSAV
jgi:glycosyltransferase involved in cell wall biosynthesis